LTSGSNHQRDRHRFAAAGFAEGFPNGPGDADPSSTDFQISALPLAPSGRDARSRTIGRIVLTSDTDDLLAVGLNYGPGGGVTAPYR